MLYSGKTFKEGIFMKNRVFVIFGHILFLLSALCLIFALVLDLNTTVRIVIYSFFIVGAVCFIVCSYCPHCHRLGLNPQPFAKNAGYCTRCGKLTEYDR